ncbi:MAG: hypothetical protein AAB509_01255 [Patescibacteria group bacterium]
MKKYKYYFRKPKSEITKDIIGALLLAGILIIAATSPYFIINIIKGLKRMNKYPNKKVYDTFYNLKKYGLIDFCKKDKQIYISLTEKGKKKAGWMQIDSLKIKKPKKWDKKWRVVMFDIAQLKKMHREALRGKLKELGFYLFQKSVWILPYDCKEEMKMIQEFFGLKDNELRLIIADYVGNDKEFRKIFKLD